MANQIRIQKISEIVKRQLSQAINEEIDFPPEVLITVGNIVVTEDLKEAKVSISIFPDAQAEKVFLRLNRRIYHLQQIINRYLQIRPVPKMIFILDRSLEKQDKIEKLIKQTK